MFQIKKSPNNEESRLWYLIIKLSFPFLSFPFQMSLLGTMQSGQRIEGRYIFAPGAPVPGATADTDLVDIRQLVRPRKVDSVLAVGMAVGIWVGFGPELGSEKTVWK